MTTTSQASFIGSLLKSRICPASYQGVNLDNLSVSEASRMIDALKSAPLVPAAPKTAPVIAEKGYYKVGDRVYTVCKAKNSDRSYAKMLHPMGNRGTWEYVPGMVTRLTPDCRITVAEAAAFGHLHGFCLVCGKTLTDPKSVAQGIGPVCITRI